MADRAEKSRIKVGDLITYGEHTYRLDEPAGPRRGWNATRLDGVRFRLKAKQIAEASIA